jgi:hypothetical protein
MSESEDLSNEFEDRASGLDSRCARTTPNGVRCPERGAAGRLLPSLFTR